MNVIVELHEDCKYLIERIAQSVRDKFSCEVYLKIGANAPYQLAVGEDEDYNMISVFCAGILCGADPLLLILD